jgi:threonine synthase
MDILISSNLERLLYITLGHKRCAECMEELAERGEYTLSEEELSTVGRDFVGYFADEEECARTVKAVYEKTSRLIDTHTAVAYHAADRYMSENKTESPMLVVSTASPYKFARDVLAALGGDIPEDDLAAPEALERRTGVEIPAPLKRALASEPRHLGVIDKCEMPKSTLDFALCD